MFSSVIKTQGVHQTDQDQVVQEQPRRHSSSNPLERRSGGTQGGTSDNLQERHMWLKLPCTKLSPRIQGNICTKRFNDNSYPKPQDWSIFREENNVSLPAHDALSSGRMGRFLPSSPDLDPMDNSMRSILEPKARRTSHASVSALKVSLIKAWDKITADTVRAACAQFNDRLRRVVATQGGHFE